MLKLNTNHFQSLNEYVYNIQLAIHATAAATYIIKNDTIVNEWYSGRHDSPEDSQPVNQKSQFNVLNE
ncbi:hypothetical protein QJ48_26315 [Paenibacillus sp. A3]|uniref:hypothetical protein n=1 Tax=Paenibacillus sp. A3 TaxID=1337054 RepID=UPI0006D52F2F|nr:hypothetical protein [Paenibacillus sp. A3]KPV56695.1 hypothetical protein QJ48_26315 [Paenibacillus sp. A3]